jgi:hypothetical protein
MADETTTAEAPPDGLNFTEDDIIKLEEEFKAPPQEDAEDEDEDEDEDPDAGLEDEGDEEEEEGEGETEGEEEEDDDLDEDEEGDKEPEAKASKKGDKKKSAKGDEKPEQGYELLVDGQQILIDTEEELAAWAQKGIHYEKKDRARQKVVDDATYTMNALINDPLASLEEIWTAKYGGNHEQARQHVAKLAETYLEPIWRELTAEPAQRLKIQQDRFNQRSTQQQQKQQQQQQNSFSQEDLQFIQTMDVQIASALEAVDLPKEDVDLRKWMADVMRDGIDRGIDPDPRAAAEFIKTTQEKRMKALGVSVPKKDRKSGGKKKPSAKKIAAAKARRSSRQGGTGTAPPGKKRQEPQFMTSRQWLDGLNSDLNLEP